MRTASSLLSMGGLALLLLLGLPAPAAAIKDTMKNRIKLADQFLEDNPVEDSIEAVARPQMAAMRDAAEVAQFKRNLDSIDTKKMSAMIRHTMIKHFTAPELEYLVDMYSQPLGRAVMSKMGAYTSDITPKLHEAMQPIMQANADFMAQNMGMLEPGEGEAMRQQAAARASAGAGKKGAVAADAKLPPRHIKVPNGVYQGSTVQDVLDEKVANQAQAKPKAQAKPMTA